MGVRLCEACLHWEVERNTAYPVANEGPWWGRCRRFPEITRKMSDDRCGEFKEKIDG